MSGFIPSSIRFRQGGQPDEQEFTNSYILALIWLYVKLLLAQKVFLWEIDPLDILSYYPTTRWQKCYPFLAESLPGRNCETDIVKQKHSQFLCVPYSASHIKCINSVLI